ncbi:MAG: thiol-disulfide isomerase/thioredoxin [Sphingobacteriales bacterium]|jgi:thiol-disulfide isomerase/thioredoxin
MKKYIILILAIAAFTACQNNTSPSFAGDYTLNIQLNDSTKITLDAQLVKAGKNYQLHFWNHTELIQSKTFSLDSGTHITLPYFENYLQLDNISEQNIQGLFINPNKTNYSIPLTLTPNTRPTPKAQSTIKKLYSLEFSPATDNYYPGQLELQEYSDNTISGTILTETGDYRYLIGTKTADSFYLNCFDGAHLFYFSGKLKGDTISNGIFYSGKHWSEPFIGVPSTENNLKNPFDLTKKQGNFTPTIFRDLSNQNFELNSSIFKQAPLTIIQIMGTWCPNCMDENIYYKSLVQQHPQIQIITVAYEIQKDTTEAIQRIKAYKKELELPWTMLYGGRASKSLSSSHFPYLNEIISYPTSIFFNQTGEIIKIHTGFYGPGTGKHYTKYTEEMEQFLQQF